MGRASGEIESDQLEGVLGWISAPKGKVGLALRPLASEPAFAEYFCGSSLFTLTGGVIVQVKANKMLVTETLKYKAAKGRQKPAQFEAGAPETLTSTPFGEAPQATALTMTATLTFAQPLEINTHF